MEIDLLKIDVLIKSWGYPLEIHNVTTEDGYILSLYRIKHGKNDYGKSSEENPPIILMHGMFDSFTAFVINESSLAYCLADHGYDVWLGNSRGTPFSRKHIHWDCDKDSKKYWDFSYHEIGYYDVPAFIDYVVENTRVPKIFYIGHSQGTTSFFSLMSTKIEYNEKIRLGIMLAPAAVCYNAPRYRFFQDFVIPYCRLMTKIFGPFEYFSPNILRKVMRMLCAPNLWTKNIACYVIKKLASTPLTPFKSNDLLHWILTFSPVAGSAKQIIHYGQARTAGMMRHFDYGAKENKRVYGTTENPPYKLSQITARTILFGGREDLFCHPKDLEILKDMIGTNAEVYSVERKDFRHLDFVFGEDSAELVNKPILEFLNEYS